MEIIKLFYFILPIYFANMAPVFLGKLNFFTTPMDFGITWNKKRLFGDHKTWKGLIGGILSAIIVVFIQSKFNTGLELYNHSQPLLFGFLLGFGALIGDAVKSFLKRRINIKSGQPWIPFDQIDYSVGALLFVSPLYFIGWLNGVIVVFFSFLLHVLANHLGYYLGIRKLKW
ncbi:CDP-archaeol synthase [Candidatus Woesearchaeota archaeon]|nr:CDP-archaeol synthase [Candidatus Woesearchaeota archaeon]